MRWTTKTLHRQAAPATSSRGIPEDLKPDVEPAGPLGLFGLPRGFECRRSTAALADFRANRRGYWSLWIFLVLFVLTLFAEFIANDRPLLIHYDGKTFFPVFVTYPETDFGGDLGTAADYRDPHLQKFLDEHNAIEIWPPIRFSYNTINDNPPIRRSLEADLDADRSRIAILRAKNGYAKCGTLE